MNCSSKIDVPGAAAEAVPGTFIFDEQFMLLCSSPHSLPRGLLVLEKKCTPFKGFGHRCAQTMFFDSHNSFFFLKKMHSRLGGAHTHVRVPYFLPIEFLRIVALLA